MLALTFAIFWALPTQPANFVYPDAPALTDAQVANANHLLGLDRPKIVQYADYLSSPCCEATSVISGRGTKLIENGASRSVRDRRDPLPRPPHHSVDHPRRITVRPAACDPVGHVLRQPRRVVVRPSISLLALVGLCVHPMVVGLILEGTFGLCERSASRATARSCPARAHCAEG